MSMNYSMNDYLEAFAAILGGAIGPLVHGGADDSGAGLVGFIEALLAAVTNLIESGSEIALLPGIRALASNVHPLIVHFPIAFLTTYFLAEIAGLIMRSAGLRQLASGMLYLGAGAAVIAAAAGLIAAAEVPHGSQVHEIMEWHQRLMLSVSIIAIVLALWRAFAGVTVSTMATGLSLFLSAAMMTLMVFGTDLGGFMVYRYGVGVASLQGQEGAHQHLHTSVEDVD